MTNYSPYQLIEKTKQLAFLAGSKDVTGAIIGTLDLLDRLIRTGVPVTKAELESVTKNRKASKKKWDDGEPAKATKAKK